MEKVQFELNFKGYVGQHPQQFLRELWERIRVTQVGGHDIAKGQPQLQLPQPH